MAVASIPLRRSSRIAAKQSARASAPAAAAASIPRRRSSRIAAKQSAPAPAAAPATPPPEKVVEPPKPSSLWKKHTTSVYEHTFPAGRYYVGDICYCIGDSDLYKDLWQRYGYKDGFYTDGLYTFGVASTAYGDGSYKGTDGFKYSVDAGCIGIVPVELFDEEKFKKGYGDCTKPGKCGRILTATRPITFYWSSDSTFSVYGDGNNFEIVTGDSQYDDEYY